MTRREFLNASIVTSASCLLPFPRTFASSAVVHTVTGPIPADELGFCLPHEHVLSRFGIAPAAAPEYDERRAMEEVVPYLNYLKELGVKAIADCTAYNFGRDARLLRRLSEESGVYLITNTGWYGAADDRYVPAETAELTAEEIADRWVAEFTDGVDDTDIRPGFVKTAVDGGPLSATDAKLVRAAAITHRQTGLRLAVHTSDNPRAALQQLDILAEEEVSPTAWTWTHAQNVPDPAPLIAAARRGAWISLDGIKTPYYQDGKLAGRDTLGRHLDHFMALREAELLDRVLLSHDGSTLPPEGRSKRPMDFLVTAFLPMLTAAGLSDTEVRQLTVGNPGRYFGVEG